MLEAHALSDGQFYAVSRVPEIPSRSLSATDLDGLELNVEQFQLHLCSLLGITGTSVPASNRQELLDLGVVDVGGQRLRLTYSLRQPPAGAGDAMRTRGWIKAIRQALGMTTAQLAKPRVQLIRDV